MDKKKSKKVSLLIKRFVVGKKKHTQKAVSNAIFESSLKINHMEYRNLLLPYKVKYKPKTLFKLLCI